MSASLRFRVEPAARFAYSLGMKLTTLIFGAVALCVTALPSAAQGDSAAPAIAPEGTQLVSYRNGDAARRFQNYDEAIRLYREECDADEATSCTSLGDMHRRGLGTNQDYQLADELYEEACTKGDTVGCRSLANLLFEGRGLAQDYTRARSLYDRACEQDDPTGCAVLGNMMYAGLGGSRQREEGAQLMREACAAEVEYACNQVQRYGIDRGNARFYNPWGGN